MASGDLFRTYVVLSQGPAEAAVARLADNAAGHMLGVAGHVMVGATNVVGKQVTYTTGILGCQGLPKQKSWKRVCEPDLRITC